MRKKEENIVGINDSENFELKISRNQEICIIRSDDKKTTISGQNLLALELENKWIPGKINFWQKDRENFIIKGNFTPEWFFQAVVKPDIEDNNIFHFNLKVKFKGNKEKQAAIRVAFDLEDQGIPRWMVPAMFYKHNRSEKCARIYPRFTTDQSNHEKLESNYWAFAADRSSLPGVFAWQENYSAALITPERNAGEMMGVFFQWEEDKARIGLYYPFREEPVAYSFLHDKFAPRVKRKTFQPDEEVELNFYLRPDDGDLHNYSSVIKKFYKLWQRDNFPSPWMSLKKGAELATYGLYQWHYSSKYRALFETCSFDTAFSYNAELPQVERPHMHIAWVSGIPYAYAMAKYGLLYAKKEYYRSGKDVVEMIVEEGLADSGLLYSEWTLEKGWKSGWNRNPDWIHTRTTGEAIWFLMKFIKLEAEWGRKHPRWEKVVQRHLDYIVNIQNDKGNFGTYYNIKNTQVVDWDGCGGLIWIPALLAGAKYFGAKKYRDAALKAGEYYTRFIDDEFLYGAPEDVHLTPTSEDGYNALIAYTHLYEVDKNDYWLNYAKKSADWMLTFRWSYNVHFKKNTFLGQYDFKTVGADLASPANNHLHNYGLICNPELLKLFVYTGDDYYLERARDHLFCFLQFIAREDGDFNARKGMVTEQFYQTDWSHPKGMMLTLAHSWCAGWIVYASLLSKEFGDIIIDKKKKKVYALEAVDIIHQKFRKEELIIKLYNPFDDENELRIMLYDPDKKKMEQVSLVNMQGNTRQELKVSLFKGGNEDTRN